VYCLYICLLKEEDVAVSNIKTLTYYLYPAVLYDETFKRSECFKYLHKNILLLCVSIIIIKIDYLLIHVSAFMLFQTVMWILDFYCTYMIIFLTHTSHD